MIFILVTITMSHHHMLAHPVVSHPYIMDQK